MRGPCGDWWDEEAAEELKSQEKLERARVSVPLACCLYRPNKTRPCEDWRKVTLRYMILSLLTSKPEVYNQRSAEAPIMATMKPEIPPATIFPAAELDEELAALPLLVAVFEPEPDPDADAVPVIATASKSAAPTVRTIPVVFQYLHLSRKYHHYIFVSEFSGYPMSSIVVLSLLMNTETL